jgi:hypothetical protein
MQIWNLQPIENRNAVDGYIFKPAPLGQEPERYVWHEGKRMLNTAPFPTFEMPPWRDPGDVTPFIRLLQRLCGEHWEWLARHLAHCAQRPHERGHHIVIFKDGGNTGKSRLFETLDLVFGRYSGPVGDALTSGFNAALEHLIVAWWSDPVIHGANDRDLESALKNFSGDSVLSINHKFGAKYNVRNYGRLFIATNKAWIVPVDSKERRYVVFGGGEVLPHEEAVSYMKWVEADGARLIREYLLDLDLSGFDIFAPGPRTDQRSEMERISAPPLTRFLTSDDLDYKDIWTVDELRFQYNDQYGKKVSNESIGMYLKNLGCLVRRIKVDGRPVRYAALRNFAKWDAEDNAGWVAGQLSKGAKYE